MGLIHVENLSHGYGDKTLFKESSFKLYKGEKMGIVGENGVGKSTLLKCIIGEEIPDRGNIIIQEGLNIGHIEQHLDLDDDVTVYGYLKDAFKEEFEMERKLSSLYEQMSEDYDKSLMRKVDEYQEKLERNNFYALESKIDKMIIGLGIDAFGEDTPVNNLSGGQQTRVVLAKLLLGSSDLLLLDEPTNFLDDNHIEWITEYLKNYDGTFIVISHNFEFLNEITNCICDIEFQDIKKYHGNYEKFKRLKAEYVKNYRRQYSLQQKKIEKEEEYIRRNRAGVNSRIARGRQKRLDRVERIAAPEITRTPEFTFDLYRQGAGARIDVKNLKIGYDFPLLSKMDFVIPSGDKIVITGFNGIGKSTLLKTMIGEIDKLGGNIKFSMNTKIGYYEQGLDWKDDGMTALEILSEEYPDMKMENLRRNLTTCGIEAEDISQPIGTLSGGEQSKVKLSRLVLDSYNLIIMDEPTNHLDDLSKQALKKALIEFEGTVILVSHEVQFYEGWIDRVFKIGETEE